MKSTEQRIEDILKEIGLVEDIDREIIKLQLENYLKVQIDNIKTPVVVYSSTPTLAVSDFNSFKNNEILFELLI